MTAAQVISLGAYLNDDFDPAALTVPQLLGVLGYHNVKYPTQYNKPKLIQLFNDEVKVNAPKLRRERLRKANSHASDDGITDGLTGMPLGGTKVRVALSWGSVHRRLVVAANTHVDDHDPAIV
jgi:hypothetical protein